MNTKLTALLLTCLLALGSAACDEGTNGDNTADGPAPTGTYTDEWGSTHEVSDTAWTATYPPDTDGYEFSVTCTISVVDEVAGFLVCENGDESWSRYDWTRDEGDLYYCQITYNAIDEQAATSNLDADRSDLDGGCGGFAWTLLTPAE